MLGCYEKGLWVLARVPVVVPVRAAGDHRLWVDVEVMAVGRNQSLALRLVKAGSCSSSPIW